MDFLSQIQAGTKLAQTPAPAPAPPKPKYPLVGSESIMAPKAHGTARHPVQAELRWGCDRAVADRICCFNRHYAEHSGSAAAARVAGFSRARVARARRAPPPRSPAAPRSEPSPRARRARSLAATSRRRASSPKSRATAR